MVSRLAGARTSTTDRAAATAEGGRAPYPVVAANNRAERRPTAAAEAAPRRTHGFGKLNYPKRKLNYPKRKLNRPKRKLNRLKRGPERRRGIRSGFSG